MRKVKLFVADAGHKEFLNALLQRFAKQYNILVEIAFENARRGHGRVITELKQYIRDLQRNKEQLPDLVIVATDANCKGFLERKQEVDRATEGFRELVICAIPDPHIERRLLLDSAAFKKVLGIGCKVPTYKCERNLYKRLLVEAVVNAGEEPIFGGMEHAEALVNAMNLEYLERTEESLGRFLKAVRHKFQEWERSEQSIAPFKNQTSDTDKS